MFFVLQIMYTKIASPLVGLLKPPQKGLTKLVISIVNLFHHLQATDSALTGKTAF